MPVGAGTAAGGAGTLFLAAAIAGGAFVYDLGAVSIHVQEKKSGGENIRLILPAAAGPVALWMVPKEKLREGAKEARPYLPAIEAAAQELSRCPDFTLVEVTNPHEKVHIAKRGGHLVIDVDDENETVHVSVPLEAARLIAAQLADIPADAASKDTPPASAAL